MLLQLTICYVICNCNVANKDVVALYLLERLNNNSHFTLEKLIFSFRIYIFLSTLFFVNQKKNSSNAAMREREKGKFSDSQIFHFYKNSKSSKRINVWIFIIFPSYELYKIL